MCELMNKVIFVNFTPILLCCSLSVSYKQNAFFLIFFAKKFGKNKMFIVPLHRILK